MMVLKASCSLLALVLACPAIASADEPRTATTAASRLTTEELASWIDKQFAGAWQESKIVPPDIVDEATFLKRAFLDLTGSIPSVSEARDFL